MDSCKFMLSKPHNIHDASNNSCVLWIYIHIMINEYYSKYSQWSYINDDQI